MKTAGAVPVLMYHHVSPNPGLVTISPENFRAQMRWLAGHGYTTIGCDDLAGFLRGEPLPAKSVLLTFDDGYLDNYVHAHPILAEFGLKAALFIITGRIGDGPARACAGEAGGVEVPPTPAHKACMAAIEDGRADAVMLRWSEVEAMRAAGSFEFHSHTHSHTRWDQVEPDVARRHALLADDLAQSRTTLQSRLGSASPHLCWPQGYHDDGYVATALAQGFTTLYTTIPGTNAMSGDATHLRRIVVKGAADWLGRRLWIYRHPTLTSSYLALRNIF
ncbi:MAG: polysaccharide deacetylase family protein [Gammaproteobacteria bacterium]|nr:polysaccharide deacetylase family protein [Gammaproteobacteria bacterium]MBU1647676.1 polysaccharide deacetylase family protein [Gammaproteobacteria bacterium]MBU1971822.1 polysaccharide deacetylase family protein [Gammaproteobacteria bacterium]